MRNNFLALAMAVCLLGSVPAALRADYIYTMDATSLDGSSTVTVSFSVPDTVVNTGTFSYGDVMDITLMDTKVSASPISTFTVNPYPMSSGSVDDLDSSGLPTSNPSNDLKVDASSAGPPAVEVTFGFDSGNVSPNGEFVNVTSNEVSTIYNGNWTVRQTTTATPEPGSLALLLLGGGGLAGARLLRRRRRTPARV